MYTKISEIRAKHSNGKTLLLNTGDTIQGSAEALFTKGQAMVDVLNRFSIDAYALGNWDWVYGVDRALELFAGPSAKAPWNALAANAYFEGEPYADQTGSRVLPPYIIREIDGVKIGILGFTTDRGPQVVGRGVTKGVRFTKGDAELKEFVTLLREKEKVALIIMMSELGLSNNIRLAEQNPGVDVILSSDMHEITREPVVTSTKTVIAEVGQDGQVIGELNLTVENGRLANWKWTLHRIDDRIKPNADIAKLIADIRKPFLSGANFTPQINPFNGTKLARPIDTVVGRTRVTLHRMNLHHQRARGRDRGQFAHLSHRRVSEPSRRRHCRHPRISLRHCGSPWSDQARGPLPFHPDWTADREGHHQRQAAQKSDRKLHRRLA